MFSQLPLPRPPVSIDGAEARMFDPVAADYIAVNVQLAADEIFILDGAGRSRKRWRYTELRQAYLASTGEMLPDVLDGARVAALHAAQTEAVGRVVDEKLAVLRGKDPT